MSDALSRAKSGDEVWLKSGQYTFSTTLGVGAVVSTDAKIRGGFAGTESSAKERKFAESTVLKGAVTALKVTATSGLVEIDHITVKGAKGHGIFKEGAASLALSYVNSEENGIVEKSVNVDYSTDGRGGFFTGDAAFSELTLDHCVFRGNREWRSGGAATFNVGGKAKTTGIGLIAKNFKRVYMTDCLMVGNGLRQQDRLGGGIAAMLSPPGEEQLTQSVFYFENAPLTATRVRFIGNRTGASGTRGGRLTYIKGGNGSSFVDCVWAANDFVCARPVSYTSPSGYDQCGSLVLDLGSQTATATISGCTFAYNVSGLGWTAGLNVEQGNVTVDESVFFGNVISSYFGRFADLHVCYRGRCTVSDSVFRGRGGMYFDDSNTRLTIDESCRYGDPNFKTTPQEFISKYVTLGVGVKGNDNAATMSLTKESFPFVEKIASFPTGGYWNGFTFWVTNDSNVEAIDLTRGEFKPIAQSEPEAPDTSCDWARKTLGIEPVQTYYMPNIYKPSATIGCQSISGHNVFWFNHTYDPDWGGVYPTQEDRFALAKPSDGDSPGRPLLVVLHSRGGGKSGAEGTIRSLGNSDSVAYCPPEFYGLVLDCMGDVNKKGNDYTVLNDFWWGAMPPGTMANGNGSHGMDASYWTFIYGTLMGELFDGPTKDPWKNSIHPNETCLEWLSRGEPSASKRVMDTIEWVVRKYKIDRNRIYLCGNSMGGQGSLGIGLPHGEVFAAINGNVPATVWYAAKRMGFVDNNGNDVSFNDYQVPAYDPPFLLNWSGSDDAWSRDHDVLYRNMSRFKFGMIGWWGDYGHCGGKKSARKKNDLVEQFPWLEIRKNEAYPVFTAASTDNKLPWPQVRWYDTGKVIIENGIEKVDAGLVPRLGCDTNGQVNAWFRWNVKADTAETFEIDLKIANSDEVASTQFTRPSVSVVDVTPRRLQAFKPTTGKVRWTYGSKSGVVAKDPKLGVYTIPRIPVSQTPTTLKLVAVPADTPEDRVETPIEVPGRYAEKPDGYAEIELRDWKFAKDDDALGKDPNAIGKLAWKMVKVPHDWAIEGPFNPLGDGGTGKLPWKGAGWYSTVLPASFSGYIVFEGVMARSRAFLDGVEVGGSDYGYMGYFFRVEKSAHERTLLVRVDTFAHKSRWYPGAGIYRPVRAIRFEGETVVPDSVKIVTKELTPERAVAEVSFDTNLSRGHSFCITVDKPRLWDVDDPHLYSVTVLGRKLKFGFRNAQFTVDKGFWLNGRRVEIRGACLHSDLGILGMEFNVSAARRQLRILKEAGFNAVRMAHNCPAPGLLDLCDEMGMLVWNECFDKWDALSGRMPSQNLEEYVSKYLRRFVRRDRLHPCVVIWSMGNEIGHNTDEKQDGTTRERCRLFRQVIREEDSTRPVGIASCEFYETMIKEGDYDDLDVVGYNYMGRYSFYRKGRSNIPVVESESASCVALQGFYLDEWPTNKFHWSIATQEVDASGRCGPGWGDPPDMDFVRMERDAYCAGQFVWTGMDYLGENWPVCVEEKTFASADGSPLALEKTARSSYFGICDLLGLPKEQYWNYRAQWKKDVNTLVISPTHWTFPGREGKRRPVQVYSNADTVELFINGRSVGRRTKNPNARQYMTKGDKRPEWAKFWGDEGQDPEGYYEVLGRYRLMWPDVVYEPGEIVAVAYGKDGKEVAVQRLCTAGEAVRLHLEPESDTLPADGDEFVFVKVTAQDAKGTLVPGAMNLVEFSVAGPGEIVSVGNADPVGHRSFKDVSAHNLHYGVAGLFIRRTGPGEVALCASAEGLKSASVKMR